jgi:hypothetical protein
MADYDYDGGQVATLSCRFLAGETVGSTIQGSTRLQVRDPSGLDGNGADIFVEGAGVVGGDLVTTVAGAIDGQLVTLTRAAGASATLVPVGMLYDPATVTGKVRLPDGTETNLTVTHASKGLYKAVFTWQMAGDNYYRFSAPGVGDRWKLARVRPERVP